MKIGERIRRRRNELGLSLRELGALTNLTAGFPGQLKNDQTSLSLDSVQDISLALQVPLFYFLKDPRPCPMVRAGERRNLYISDSQTGHELLPSDLTWQMVRPRVPPKPMI